MSVNLYNATSGELERIAGVGEIPRWKGTQVEWNTLDKSTLSDGTYVEIIDDVVTLPVHNVYSTDETPIGTWINGEPIYRKVYSASNVLVSTNGYYIGNIPSNVNVIRVYGFMEDDSNTMFHLPYISPGLGSGSIAVVIEYGNSIKVTCLGYNRNAKTVNVVIEYTK